MSSDDQKIQIGIRLPVAIVRKIDVLRGNKTRAEFCRESIEMNLANTDNAPSKNTEIVVETLDSLQEQSCRTYQSAILTQHDAAKTIVLIEHLHSSVATAVVGILTKLGQVVREEDQRKFAREKAEQFAKRIFYSEHPDQEEQY
jgi:metal-responsive CopG/Arc/MetJ family transcriptional regulator